MKSLHLSRPHAIMMVGIPGSGKSFFAEKFAETFNTPYIDSLDIETRSANGASASELISLFLTEIAKTQQTFIYEGNSDSRVRRTEFAQWARKHGYHPILVWTQADTATSLRRTLKMKTLSKPDFDKTVHDFSPPHPDEKPIVISGKHTYASQAKVVLAHLSRENRPHTPSTAPARRDTAPRASTNNTQRTARNIVIN